MHFMDLGVRVQLDRLKVERTDDGPVAGSADEPYLWLIVAKLDGTTVFENSPQTSTVSIHSSPPAPENLGPAAEGVKAGKTIAIPASVGRHETILRGATGSALVLTRFATLVVVIAALEHDDSRKQDIVELHSRLIKRAKTGLQSELREIVQEVAAGDVPSAGDVRKRLEAQLSEETIRQVIDDFKDGLIGAPINVFNQDVFVGHNIDTVLSFPDVLARSVNGTPIDVRLHRGSADNATYRVWGSVTRTDIQEPPTIGLVRLDDKRLQLGGRSVGARAFIHERSSAGDWGVNKPLGVGVLSSGVALAASADGKRRYGVGRGVDKRLHIHQSDTGDVWATIANRTFSTGAGVACSSDGRLVYVMGTGDDGKVYATSSVNGAGTWEADWKALGVRSVASPALACTANGRKLFLVTLGEDRKLYLTVIEVEFPLAAPRVRLNAALTLALDSRRFISAPACACSDDGKRQWIAAAAEDGQMCILKPEVQPGATDFWIELGELVSAPALACSPDGQTVHIAAIDKALRLRHRFSSDAGVSWPKRGGQNWEVLQENASWY